MTIKCGLNVYPLLCMPVLTGQAGQAAVSYPNASKMVPSDARALAAMGVDTVRIMLDPTPALSGQWWTTAFNPAVAAAQMFVANGVQNVILVVTPDINAAGWDSNAIAQDPGKLNTCQQFVGQLAGALNAASVGPTVYLESWNEPQYWDSPSDFAAVQLRIYRLVRQTDPARPVILTFPKSSWLAGMSYIDPAPYTADPLAFFTFHWYGPRGSTSIADQGTAWANRAWRQKMTAANGLQLRWPEQPARKGPFVAKLKTLCPGNDAAINADVAPYFDVQSTSAMVAAEFATATAWLDAAKIPRSRMILGEFGAYRNFDPTIGGAPTLDAMRFMSDVRLAAEAAGFPWLAFNYWPSDPGPGYSLNNADGSPCVEIMRDGLGLTV